MRDASAFGRQIIDGPCWEAIMRTAAPGGAEIPEFTYKPEVHWHEQIRVNILVYTYVLNEMILKYDCVKSAVQQPATLHNHLTGYRYEDVDFGELKSKLEKSSLFGVVSAEALKSFLHRCKIDRHVACKDADTSVGRSRLEYMAIADLTEIYKFYRTIRGLENLSIDLVANETGIRESNRIVGEKEVLTEEYLQGVFRHMIY